MKVQRPKSKVKSWLREFIAMLVLSLLGSAAFAADTSGAFDAANKLYEQGRFTEAATAYQKLIQSGTVSSAVYFNLGNAEFKAGELGRAVAAYHRAEQLTPRDPDVRANLQFVRKQIQGPTVTPGRWAQWFSRLTVNEWTTLAVAAFWIWLLWLGIRQVRPALRQSTRSSVWLGGIIVALLCACLGFALVNASAKTAIVIAHETVAHNGPLDESPAAFTAHDGAELQVLDKKDNWLQVTLGDRRIGWLKRDQVVLSQM